MHQQYRNDTSIGREEPDIVDKYHSVSGMRHKEKGAGWVYAALAVIGQWQKGVPHIVDPGPKRTAAPIYPKQPWGAPAA